MSFEEKASHHLRHSPKPLSAGALEDLLRRAKKAERRKKFPEALRLYREFRKRSAEPDVGARIEAVEKAVTATRKLEAYDEAKRAGDHQLLIEAIAEAELAANLPLDRRCALGRERAVALARLRRFEESLAIFEETGLPGTASTSEQYAYGLALAGRRRFIEAISVWVRLLPRAQETFRAQFQKVLGQAVTEGWRTEPAKLGALINDLSSFDSVHPALSPLRHRLMETLWDKGDWRAVRALLPPLDREARACLIFTHAKVLYRLVEHDSGCVAPLVETWLTASFSAEMLVSPEAAREAVVCEVQSQLLVMLEEIIGRAGDKTASLAAVRAEGRLITQLATLEGVNWPFFPLRHSPSLAASLGVANCYADALSQASDGEPSLAHRATGA